MNCVFDTLISKFVHNLKRKLRLLMLFGVCGNFTLINCGERNQTEGGSLKATIKLMNHGS